MGAPFGNQNAVKGKRWAQALERAIQKRSGKDMVEALDDLAEKFLDAIEEMSCGTEKRPPSIAGFVELADRLDGRATQSTEISGPEGDPVNIKVVGLPGGGG